MKHATMLVWAFVLALVLVAAVHGDGEGGNGENGEPVIGVDSMGNLHINTTSSNTTVYLNGQDMKQMMAALMAQQAAQSAELSQLRCAARRFSPPKGITTSADYAVAVFAADLDGDGDVDVLSASSNDDKIAWYENEDGLGTFSAQRAITTNADGARRVCAADLDGDGDLDVLSASRYDGKVAWYENLFGNGTFSGQKIITTSADGAFSVAAADLDGDGDLDVVSASVGDDKIAWYENVDGFGTFSQEKIISTGALGAISVFTADLDGDGDMDVLSASYIDDKIAWYRNEAGQGVFSGERVITLSAAAAYSVFAADLDGDGDMDVLSASRDDDKIAWYENVDGEGTFSEQNVITTYADYAISVFAADIDGDGDDDVLSASTVADKIAWYENVDGNGSFSFPNDIASASGARSVFAADIDGDGDMDVLSASFDDDKIAWYENLCG